MGNLSAAMLAEVLSPAPELHVILDLQLPSGTRRYAALPVKSSSLGQYQGRIQSMGSLFRAASDAEGQLVYPRLGDITIEDADGQLAKALELTESGGSPITVRMASPNVTNPADWYTLAGNFRLDDWRQDEALIWTLSFSYYDTPLRSPFPRTPILRPDFPNAADPVIYTYHVLIPYGVHDSRGVGDKGMVPCYYVDTVNGDFGPWLGWITVDRVYKNGAIQTSGVSTIHPLKNGRLYTLIHFTTPPVATDVVTADITGYFDGTDGAGSLLTGANAIKHALVNFIYPTDDWKAGAWFLDSSAPVSTTHFAEMQTFLTAMGWEKVSRQLGGNKRMTAEDALNEWCASRGKIGVVGSFITNDGKIAVRPNDHRTTTLFHSGTRWIRYQKDELDKTFTLRHERHTLADRITVEFLPNSVDENYRWSIEVQDLTVGRNALADLQLPWSSSQLD